MKKVLKTLLSILFVVSAYSNPIDKFSKAGLISDNSYEIQKNESIHEIQLDHIFDNTSFTGNFIDPKNNKKADEILENRYYPRVIKTTDQTNWESRSIYFYDDKGNILKVLNEKLYNNTWVNTNRLTYTYDENGNRLTYLIEEYFAELNSWINIFRYSYTYDQIGNNLIIVGEQWMDEKWYYSRRITNTYDNKSNLLTTLHENWDNKQWVNSSRTKYTYDERSNLLIELIEVWENARFEYLKRNTYTYNERDSLLTHTFENWDGNDKEPSSRLVYTYNNKGFVSSLLNKTLSNNKWVNFYLRSYEYDDDGNLATDLVQHWENENWLNKYRYKYSYNQDGTISIVNELWIENKWTNNILNTTTYDQFGNKLVDLYQKWENDKWISYGRITKNYDIDGYFLSGINEIFSAGSWRLRNGTFDFDNKSFGCAKIEVEWTTLPTSVEDIIDNNFLQIFPNPASEYIEINYDAINPTLKRRIDEDADVIKIYDSLGENLMSVRNADLRSLQRIDISHLPVGLYFVQMGNRFEKFIKI